MDLIAIGQSVNIKRTDGRVHSAVVSKINENFRSVTVEWYEKGETKGKEVEMDTLLQLNHTLLAAEPKKPAAVPLSRGSTQSSDEGENEGNGRIHRRMRIINDGDDDGLITDKSQLTTNGGHNLTQGSTTAVGGQHQIPTGCGGTLSVRSPVTSRIPSNATQGAIRLAANKLNAGVMQNGHRQNRPSAGITGGNYITGEHIENIPPTGLQKSRTTVNAKMSVANPSAYAVQPPPTGNPGQRRSYVVKEVEKLKENREQRRARQAELKAEKNALMNLDPGNPNWETAAMIRDYQGTLDFRPLVDGQAIEDHQITVCVRKRPLSRKELNRKEVDVISVPSKDMLIVHEPRNKVDLTKFLEHHKFRFDYAFDDHCDNEIVYKYTAKPLVKTIFEGGMATCFAYGQTGSGKTHTMGGEFNGKVQDCKNGIYAKAAKDVFDYLHGSRYQHLNLVVSASFFEIYSGKVFDLLSDKQKLRVLEDGKQQVQVVGLTEKVVDSVEEVLKLIQHGNNARTSGQTSANANSSRSHAVFQIVLRPPGSNKIHGKFSFIDLAGNERGADTSSANRQTRMEGAEINKSLLALKECIRALGKQSAHLPFRVSKLTQVLRDSFIGEKSKTCMIAMISPGLSSCEHTLNTLRYADRVKELVVKDPSDIRPEDDILEEMESDDLKNGEMNENELAHLRSLSEQDMSDELFNQHAVISDLQRTEEYVVDQHKFLNELLEKLLVDSKQLYDVTNYVDYDQEAYCKKGEEIFTHLVEYATTCRGLMSEFRTKLAKEEMLSHSLVAPSKR